jgi:FkbM family methyltransferase
MKRDAIVVSALNHDYFHYLRDLLHSFVACGAHQKYDLGIIDAGLWPEDIAWLERFGVARIVRPDWPFPELQQQPEWTKACFCRPFFPDYFPDWEVVVYFDADSWLQDTAIIDHAVAAAQEDGFAAVPMADRNSWPPQGKTSAVFSILWHRDRLIEFFGPEAAERYQWYPLAAGSFFAGRRNAPHWQAWRRFMAMGLRRSLEFSIDQTAMTLALYDAQLPVHFLPHHFHWVCHLGAIGLDAKTGRYVEPYRPHQPIASLSLAAHTKTEPVLTRTTDGRILSRLLRYGAQHRPSTVNVAGPSAALAFDGIARQSFRDRVFAAVSQDGPVRFLQIGAMDGVSFDPLHHAIRRYGWQGVLVEPLPDMQARLRATYADMPGLDFAPVAIADACGTQAMRRIAAAAVTSGTVPPWAGGLSSLAPERNALGGKGIDATQHSLLQSHGETVEVECLDFAEFERRYRIAGFDVLQIDTEGYDWRVLRQIDLMRHAPRCIHVEIACLPPEEIAAMLDHLRAAGHVCYMMEDGQDLLALRRDFGSRHFGIL